VKPFIRSRYNYDTRLASKAARVPSVGELITDQSAKDEADINVIVRRFGVTSLISNVPLPPTTQDFSEQVFDFQTSMNLLRAAQESFDQLSSAVRDRFRNDPHLFVDFCSEVDDKGNLANLEQMRKMGLAVPAKPDIIPPPPLKVEVINPAPLTEPKK